jgi:hypothetical protein
MVGISVPKHDQNTLLKRNSPPLILIHNMNKKIASERFADMIMLAWGIFKTGRGQTNDTDPH